MRKYWIVFLMLGMGAAFTLYNCSLLGLGVGASIDAKAVKSIAGWEVLDLPKDTKIAVFKKDGAAPVRGMFKGGAKANPALDTAVNVVLVELPTKQIQDIPLNNIAYVEIKRKTDTAKTIGFLAGLAVDVALIVALRQERTHKHATPPPDTGYSCPYFYSYDGTGYRLDAELFAGSFFKSAERPDWDNLDHLKAADGVYRLKMVNELQEKQYVDQLRLLVVDHPVGSQVYPAFNGQLFTLMQPQSPRAAQDFAGTDVREKLLANDAEYWVSNPFGRNPEKAEELKDGVTLEFERPAGANSAALLFRAQNTGWSSTLLKHLLTLPGDYLPQWYATLEQSEEARNAVSRAMVREATLRIYLWDGAQWRPAGYLWEVGTGIAKDVVMEVDLTGIPGDVLRLKLESTPGLWMLNSIQADFSYFTMPSNARPLDLKKATDQNGRDVKPLMQKADNQYYEMAATGDFVLLEFPTLPTVRGKQRSFILQGSGYYTIQMEPKGTPRMAEVEKLIKEPGAIARFALSNLQTEMTKYLQGIRIVQ